MAISLLTVLLALGALHLMPSLARWRGAGLFQRWVAQLGDLNGGVRVLLALLLPLMLCVLALWLLSHALLASLFTLLFSFGVLVYSLGPREFEQDLETILEAPDALRREAAAQQLAGDGSPIAWDAAALGVAIAYAALRRRFAVLFWFFLLGPVGALLYRLAQRLSRDAAMPLDESSRSAARHFGNALDWLPAQLMVFTLAVVGHWEAVIGAWRRWYNQASPTGWYRNGPDFLGAAAQADILTDIEAGDGYADDRSDPLVELIRLRSALLRALLAWLSVVALIVLGGWIH